jgi:hypothetical protein
MRAKVDPAILAQYILTYDLTENTPVVKVAITLEDGRLTLQSAGEEKNAMFAERRRSSF